MMIRFVAHTIIAWFWGTSLLAWALEGVEFLQGIHDMSKQMTR